MKTKMGLSVMAMFVFVSWAGCVSVQAAEQAPAAAPAITNQLYGFLHLGMDYNTSRLFPGNYALYCMPNRGGREDNKFDITASPTRIGYKFDGPEVSGAKLKGNLEVDFIGGGAENKSTIMMRHGYFEMIWGDVSLIAGQTWDLIMSQYPDTINVGVGWYAGNIGYRHPQVRVSKTLAIAEGSKLILKAAASRTIGESLAVTANNNGDTGADAGVPTGQFSARYQMPGLGGKNMEIGLAGHLGVEEWDKSAINEFDTLKSYSLRADINLPLAEKMGLKASAWKGSNLDEYMGGIGQGVNSITREAINSNGGWVTFNWETITIGYTIDLPQYDQLAVGGKQQNTSAFANIWIPLMTAVKLGFEVSSWQTLYKESDAGTALRAHTVLMYSF